MPVDPDDFDKQGPPVTRKRYSAYTPPARSVISSRQKGGFASPPPVSLSIGKFLGGATILTIIGIVTWFVTHQATKVVSATTPVTTGPTPVQTSQPRQLKPVPFHPKAASPNREVQARIVPSFNCTKAHTPSEKLICRNDAAASAELAMVATYNELLTQLSRDARTAFRREHYEWFKEFSRTCNAMADSSSESDLANCVVEHLSSHTAQLRQRLER
jgi:uncharacterized protein YecT (DUF1311 family)